MNESEERKCPECGGPTGFIYHNGDPDQGSQEVCMDCDWEGEPG